MYQAYSLLSITLIILTITASISILVWIHRLQPTKNDHLPTSIQPSPINIPPVTVTIQDRDVHKLQVPVEIVDIPIRIIQPIVPQTPVSDTSKVSMIVGIIGGVVGVIVLLAVGYYMYNQYNEDRVKKFEFDIKDELIRSQNKVRGELRNIDVDSVPDNVTECKRLNIGDWIKFSNNYHEVVEVKDTLDDIKYIEGTIDMYQKWNYDVDKKYYYKLGEPQSSMDDNRRLCKLPLTKQVRFHLEDNGEYYRLDTPLYRIKPTRNKPVDDASIKHIILVKNV